MNSFDVTVFHAINHFAGHVPVLDAVMKFFAQYALELYGVLFIAAWLALPKRSFEGRQALVVSVCAGVVALLVNVLISHIWYRSRPFISLHPGDYTRLIPHSIDASFPSDHTSGSFAFASATWGKSERWISRSFTIIAVLVMISRVYCGVHWPTDVIAGMIVGTLSGRLIWKLERFIQPVTKVGMRIFRFGEIK